MPVSPDPAGASALAARKATVRADLLAARRVLTPDALAQASVRVRTALKAVLPVAAGRGVVVAGYAPTGSEPGGTDLPEVLHRALPPDGVLLLPVLRDDLDLDWARYDGRLEASPRGLPEPPGPRLGLAAVASSSLVVVPAIAVDRRGIRLGRGGGSFDRALTRVPAGVPVVALLHDGELRDHDLPAQPHDRLVSAAITPTDGLVRLPS
jgi:5-formyltetrahydrofolate cyclo-ligase